MTRLLPGLLALAGLTLAVPCAASEGDGSAQALAASTSAWAQRPLVLEGRFSLLGSPSGIVAVGASYALLPWLSLGAGAGVSTNGPQLDVMARLRLLSFEQGDGSFGFYLGLGGSEGRYNDILHRGLIEESLEPQRSWEHAWWGNLELGLGKQWTSGLSLRLYAGNGWNLSRGSGTCVTHDNKPTALGTCGSQGYTFAYAGLALGYAFSL